MVPLDLLVHVPIRSVEGSLCACTCSSATPESRSATILDTIVCSVNAQVSECIRSVTGWGVCSVVGGEVVESAVVSGSHGVARRLLLGLECAV